MKPVQEILAQLTQFLERIYESATKHIGKVSTHKANPSMVKDILVDYHKVPTPIGQIAAIKVVNNMTLEIDPWEKAFLPKIDVAIVKAQNTDLRPQNTGDVIRVSLPPLTGDRRLQLTKKIHTEAENIKIKIRQERKKANKQLDELKTEGVSEDMLKRGREEVQKLTKKYIDKIVDFEKEVVKQITQL